MVVRAIWFSIDFTSIFQEVHQTTIQVLVVSYINILEQHAHRDELSIKFICILWNIWIHRNRRLLQSRDMDLNQMIIVIQKEVYVILSLFS